MSYVSVAESGLHFSWLSNIPVCLTFCFLHSPGDECGSLVVLAFMNNSAVNICLVFEWAQFFKNHIIKV